MGPDVVWAGCLRLGGGDSEQSNHDCLLWPCPTKHEHGYATPGLRKYQGGNPNRVAGASVRRSAAWLFHPKRARLFSVSSSTVRGSAAWLFHPKRACFFSVSSGTVRGSAAWLFHPKRAYFSSSSGGTVQGICDAPAWKLGYGQFSNCWSKRGEVHETEGRRANNSNVEELAKFFSLATCWWSCWILSAAWVMTSFTSQLIFRGSRAWGLASLTSQRTGALSNFSRS